jgi:serine protease AprX
MLVATVVIAAVLSTAAPAAAQTVPPRRAKLDSILAERALRNLAGRSRVLVEFKATPDVRVFGASTNAGRRIGTSFQAGSLDNRALLAVAADSRVARLMVDRVAFSTNQRVNSATGAALARTAYDLTGRGVGVAVIDSGVAALHNDLIRTKFGSSGRVSHYKDFTTPALANVAVSVMPTDEYGHGTHVAGIIAGNGFDSNGAKAGIAPGAKIIALKVLDGTGQGYISDVIAAIDYAISIKENYRIRVINLSVASGVFESYADDPLTLAARRAVDAGIVVVAAAGNLGQNEAAETQFGGITSPGNAPWVLTVGAASSMGTAARSDDEVAGFSSRGPTSINFSAKPDILAYGVGIESLAAPGSTIYNSQAHYLLPGTAASEVKPYLSLTGTSMAAPVVAGTVALMMEANPQLTPNAVKAILQYTAEVMTDASAMSQGAGLLNSQGAVRLARYFKSPTATFPETSDLIAGAEVHWAEHIIWGNFRISGGMPLPGSNAWSFHQPWGALATFDGHSVIFGAADDANIVWSTDEDNNIVWSTSDEDGNIVWSTDEDSNIVWSTGDAAEDSNIVWSTDDYGNIVWSTFDDQDSNIVWSTAVAQNVVWGNDCGGRNCPQRIWGSLKRNGTGVWGTIDDDGNIVWSTDDDANIVWSTDDDGNIVWSTDELDGNIVWSTEDDGNIVWSTDNDGNIVWSTGDDANIVWSTDEDGNIVWSTEDDGNIVWSTMRPQQLLWSTVN